MKHRTNPQRLWYNLPASKPRNTVHSHSRAVCTVCGADWFSFSGLIQCQRFRSNACSQRGGLFTPEMLTLGYWSIFVFHFLWILLPVVLLLCHFAGAWFFTLRTWPHVIFSLKIACSLQRARFHFPQKGNNACINVVNSGELMIGVIVSISSRWRKFMSGHKQMFKSGWLIG